MSPEQQERFVRELSWGVVNKILVEINEGQIPENWDGIELRWLLAERFKDAVLSNTSTRIRKTEFNRYLINHNL